MTGVAAYIAAAAVAAVVWRCNRNIYHIYTLPEMRAQTPKSHLQFRGKRIQLRRHQVTVFVLPPPARLLPATCSCCS